MQLLDTLDVPSSGGIRRIELLKGDLSAIPVEHAVDALAVSAFRGSYAPVRGTLIGALHRRGLSVEDLARHKEVDLLDISNCWISGPIENTELNFRHLLCIEPAVNKQAPAAVGDVFRSLIPYVTGEPWISRIALPLLSAGNQGFDPVDMLRAILDASIHWLSTGLPLAVMKIVIYEREPDELIARAQETFRWYAANMDVQRSQEDNWDVFVSYSHADADVVGNLVDRMRKLDPTIRVFHDRSELAAGNAWQHRIFAAIDASRKVVCLFSPEYLKSDVCLEEYNIAHLRNREEGEILIPAYLRSTALPSYMRLLQYVDVRECDSDRLDDLAHRLVGKSRRAESSEVSVRADASPELTRVIDVVVPAGKEVRLEIRVRADDAACA